MGIYTPNEDNCMVFRARKDWRNSYRWITITPSNMRSTEPPEFNEGTLHIPRRQERVPGRRRGFGIDGGQDLTSHDRGPMSPKPSSPSEESDNRILKGYCGAKEFDNPGPLYTKPKTHAEEG